jgi:cytochrome P450
LVYYLINPLVLINVLKEYGFLETFPEFDPALETLNYENAIQRIHDFFEDTDKLELMIKMHLDAGGEIPKKMMALLDDMQTDHENGDNNLPRYFRSMIFSAVESTASFISTLVYVVLNKYPELLTKENPGKDLHWIANEVLRIYTPVPFIYRTVWKDMTYGNTKLKSGDMIVLFLGAANNDPDFFPEPHLFNEHRKEKHLSFGGGGYACIGRFASFRIALNVLSYLTHYANQFEVVDKDAKHYIHNSMLKLSLKVIYRDKKE